MSKRKLGQLYIDYTPNYVRIKPKYVNNVEKSEEETVVPGLPDPFIPDEPGGDSDETGGDTDKPEGDTDKPGGDTDKPGGNTDKPGGDTDKPGGDTDKPGDDSGNNEDLPGGDGGMDFDNPDEDPRDTEHRFHRGLINGDSDVSKSTIQRMARQWGADYAKDFRMGAHERVFGGPAEEVVADSLSMHEYSKLSKAAYHRYYHGHEVANTYLKDPNHSYIDGFNKWEIDRTLSTADDLVLYQTGEGGVSKVTVAYRGTIHKPFNSLSNVQDVARDWKTNMQMVFGDSEATTRLNNADNQMMRVISKYGRDKITVTGHSQGGGVSTYMAEKYNVPGHHYQPAMFMESRRRILGIKDFKEQQINVRDVRGSEAAMQEKRLNEMYADQDLQDVNLTDERPLLQEQKRVALEDVRLKDPKRSIYGERNASWMHDEAHFSQAIKYEKRAAQNVYRTRGDVVSGCSMSGIDKNKNWKVNVINSTLENHDNMGNIHALDNFHPPPATETAVMERSALLAGEQSAEKVLVQRASKMAALSGIGKAVGYGAGGALTVYDTYNNMSKFMNDKNLSKEDKATLGTLEVTKQAGAFALADVAGAEAGAVAGAALAGMAPAIVASGGTLLIALAVGVGVAVGVTMLGNYAEHHYKEIKGGFKKFGKGVANVAKKTGKGIESAAKKTGKGIKSAAKKVGKGFKKVFHF